MILLPSLAVIVIARNEEQTIERCLTACMEAVEAARVNGLVSKSEIVLVDSASTDQTVQIARRLPVSIVEIPPHWPLSAAAGRFVGLRSTESDLVLFVDADYVLETSWLPIGLRCIVTNDAAGVCGVDQEALVGRSAISRYVLEIGQRSMPSSEVVDADVIAVGLFRRDWIDRAGGIQPFLKGAEDRDLAVRIRSMGGVLLKTRALMGTHHWMPGEDLNFIEYFRSVSRWSYGEGQAARLSYRVKAIRKFYLKRYMNLRHLIQVEQGFLLGSWIGAVVAAILAQQFLGATVLLTAGIVYSFLISESRRQMPADFLFGFHSIPYAVVRLGCFCLGFLDSPLPSASYPKSVLP